MDEPAKLRAAIIPIDFEALERLLKMPKGHHIQRTICPSNEWQNTGRIQLVVTGPSLPEVEEGHQLPLGSLWQNEDGSVEFK